MVEKVPTALEYFSYVINFQSLMAGPLIFYRDYMEFIEGCNIMKKSHSNVSFSYDKRQISLFLKFQGKSDESSNKIVREPSPVKAVVKKVLACLVCAYIFVKFINMYPIKNLKGKSASLSPKCI